MCFDGTFIRDKHTPLHLSAAWGIRDKHTPLHLSAAWGLEKTVQYLMEHNADINAKVILLID